MGSTRYKGRDGVTGPVIGALQCIPILFDDVANSETIRQRIELPTGSGFEVTDIKVSAGSVTGDPSLTIGVSAAGTEVVAAATVTTDLGSLTIKDGTADAGEFLDVVLVADAGDAAESVSISLWGHITSEPSSVAKR